MVHLEKKSTMNNTFYGTVSLVVVLALASLISAFPMPLPSAKPVLNALDFDPTNGKWYINRERAGPKIENVNAMGVSLKLLDRLELVNRRLKKLEKSSDSATVEGAEKILMDPVLHIKYRPNHKRGENKRLPISKRINKRFKRICRMIEVIEVVEIETRRGGDDMKDFWKICK